MMMTDINNGLMHPRHEIIETVEFSRNAVFATDSFSVIVLKGKSNGLDLVSHFDGLRILFAAAPKYIANTLACSTMCDVSSTSTNQPHAIHIRAIIWITGRRNVNTNNPTCVNRIWLLRSCASAFRYISWHLHTPTAQQRQQQPNIITIIICMGRGRLV